MRPQERAKRLRLWRLEPTWPQQSHRAFQLLPGLRVSSKPEESRSLVLVVNNKLSGPAPGWRSVWRRKISSAITTEEMDYLYKIMKLFLHTSIISPKRDVIREVVFFFFRQEQWWERASMKMLETCGKRRLSNVDSKWLADYRSLRELSASQIPLRIRLTLRDDAAAESREERKARVRTEQERREKGGDHE